MQILLADDHPIFRKGLKALIEDNYDHCVIIEADNGLDAIKKLTDETFTICILDIDMPGASGIDVLKFIKEKSVKVKPIMLTMHNDELFFNEAFDEGAHGFLLKEDSSIEIVGCLTNILAGIPFVSKKLNPFLENRSNFTSKRNEMRDALGSLSNAEFNTLKLVALNKTSKEISELLFVTEKSVENYRSRICKKLNISGGSNTLYKWCVENKPVIERRY
jgi:DNA-binding NarL/FixJ family response regulator